jgi:hypothetical protein
VSHIRSSTSGQTLQPWYRNHLFVNQATSCVLLSAERARIRTLDWKPPPKIWLTACMLCTTRSLEAVGNQVVLRKLGLDWMADDANAKLAAMLEAIP